LRFHDQWLTGFPQTFSKLAYAEIFERSLADDVRDETSGDFKHLLMAMILAERDELFEVDEDQAAEDAQAIFDVRMTLKQKALFSAIARWSLV